MIDEEAQLAQKHREILGEDLGSAVNNLVSLITRQHRERRQEFDLDNPGIIVRDYPSIVQLIEELQELLAKAHSNIAQSSGNASATISSAEDPDPLFDHERISLKLQSSYERGWRQQIHPDVFNTRLVMPIFRWYPVRTPGLLAFQMLDAFRNALALYVFPFKKASINLFWSSGPSQKSDAEMQAIAISLLKNNDVRYLYEDVLDHITPGSTLTSFHEYPMSLPTAFTALTLLIDDLKEHDSGELLTSALDNTWQQDALVSQGFLAALEVAWQNLNKTRLQLATIGNVLQQKGVRRAARKVLAPEERAKAIVMDPKPVAVAYVSGEGTVPPHNLERTVQSFKAMSRILPGQVSRNKR